MCVDYIFELLYQTSFFRLSEIHKAVPLILRQINDSIINIRKYQYYGCIFD